MTASDLMGMKSEQMSIFDMGTEDPKEKDPLFPHAKRLVIKEQRVSCGMLQRFFRISYYRAENLIRELEKAGVIGPEVPGKYRRVLIKEGDKK